jgi:hypothetical protein
MLLDDKNTAFIYMVEIIYIYIYIYLGNWSEETTLGYLDADGKLIRKCDFKK